jgi:predicted GNAT family N-acyltransferase
MARVFIRRANYQTDEAAIRRVRFAVFVAEQQVPAELEMDERDPECRHVLAFDGREAVGTGRIDPVDGKIGRVAVLASQRGRGIGTAVMGALHDIARAGGLDKVWCNAQVSAMPFYRRLGYRVTGQEPFEEAGIEHVRMEKTL